MNSPQNQSGFGRDIGDITTHLHDPGMLNTDAALLEAARTRHGIVSSELLLLLGFSRGQIARRVDAGILVSVHRGVFMVNGFPLSFRSRAHAALLAGPGLAVSSRSVTHLRGLGTIRPPILEVITTASGPRRLEGVRIVRTRRLPDDHVELHDSLRMTTVARSIFDAAAVSGPGAISRLINRAVHSRATSIPAIAAVVGELGTRGHLGAGRLREVLALLGDGPPTESILEDQVLDVLRRFSLPMPERQVTFRAAGGRQLRVDFLYRAEKVVLEAEGRIWHSHPDDFQDDIERDQIYAELGLLKVPISAFDVRRRAGRVAGVIAAVLRSRRAATGYT